MTNFRCLFLLILLIPAPRGAVLAQGRALGPSTAIGQYQIRTGDILQIRVWPDSALGGNYPVEETGIVYLPLLGGIKVANRALDGLRQELREKYGEAMKQPVVTVTPLFRVSVLGAVERPGLYQADPSLTIVDLIGMAGGFTRQAAHTNLTLVRNGQVYRINGARALDAADPDASVRIESGDRLFVPERHTVGAQALVYLLQTATLAITIVNLTRK